MRWRGLVLCPQRPADQQPPLTGQQFTLSGQTQRARARSRRPSVHDGRNDLVVTLENQVVEVG
jgi:hypothetical protein